MYFLRNLIISSQQKSRVLVGHFTDLKRDRPIVITPHCQRCSSLDIEKMWIVARGDIEHASQRTDG